jgi:hypothetical protein
MSRIVDNLIAYRILSMLVQPFKETKAYQLGIVDEEGKILKKTNDLKTAEEKDAYNYLTRLIFNMKRIINKLPGGESKLRNIVAAYFLVKESYESGDRSTSQMQQKLEETLKLMDNGVVLAEEEVTVRQYIKIFEEVSGAPANATGAAVSTDQPVIRKNGRKFASFNVKPEVLSRFENGKKKYKKWSEYLNLQDETEQQIYQFARKNPKAVIVLKNGDNTKAIRFNRYGGGSWNKLSNRKVQDIEVQVG